jgi:hypothetical protein
MVVMLMLLMAMVVDVVGELVATVAILGNVLVVDVDVVLMVIVTTSELHPRRGAPDAHTGDPQPRSVGFAHRRHRSGRIAPVASSRLASRQP